MYYTVQYIYIYIYIYIFEYIYVHMVIYSCKLLPNVYVSILSRSHQRGPTHITGTLIWINVGMIQQEVHDVYMTILTGGHQRRKLVLRVEPIHGIRQGDGRSSTADRSVRLERARGALPSTSGGWSPTNRRR